MRLGFRLEGASLDAQRARESSACEQNPTRARHGAVMMLFYHFPTLNNDQYNKYFHAGVVIHTFHPNTWGQKQADLPIRDQPGLNSEFQGN